MKNGQREGKVTVNVRARVARALLDREQLDLDNFGDADAGHDPQREGAHQGRRGAQVLLERVDAEQGELAARGVVVAVARQKEVHHLLHFDLSGTQTNKKK